jgi:outer membrane autotransporter protein
LSARLSRVFDLGDRKIVPQLRADWRHEFLDRGQSFDAAFAAAPNVFFAVDGTEYARDQIALGVSMTMPLTGNLTGYADAQTAFSAHTTSTMASVGVRATW